jgi:hypothetical protein
MQSSYPAEPLVAAAAIANRAAIESAAASGKRHMLVLNITGLEASGSFAAHMNDEDHSVPAVASGPGDTFPRDVSHVWNRYDVAQVIPVIVVDLSRPFTGIMVCRLPWVAPAAQKAFCAHCGATSGPCAGTAATAPPTCR